MKKLIIKTIAITMVILVAVTGVFYLTVSLFYPRVLANFYFNLQNHDLTLKYSVKAYEASGDINDLSTLCERCIVFDEDENTVKYCTTLINDSEYDILLSKKSSGYHNYIVGSLCEAQYKSGDKSLSVETAFNNTSNYDELNPIHRLILLCANQNDKTTLSAIKQKLIDRQDKNELLQNHLILIDELIN